MAQCKSPGSLNPVPPKKKFFLLKRQFVTFPKEGASHAAPQCPPGKAAPGSVGRQGNHAGVCCGFCRQEEPAGTAGLGMLLAGLAAESRHKASQAGQAVEVGKGKERPENRGWRAGVSCGPDAPSQL